MKSIAHSQAKNISRPISPKKIKHSEKVKKPLECLDEDEESKDGSMKPQKTTLNPLAFTPPQPSLQVFNASENAVDTERNENKNIIINDHSQYHNRNLSFHQRKKEVSELAPSFDNYLTQQPQFQKGRSQPERLPSQMILRVNRNPGTDLLHGQAYQMRY